MHRKVKSSILYALLWTSIALFFIAQTAVRRALAGVGIDWSQVVTSELLYWTPFYLLTPGLLFMARSFPFDREHLKKRVAVHFGGSLVFALLQVLMLAALQYSIFGFMDGTEALRERLAERFWLSLPVLTSTAFYKYWIFMGIFYAIEYQKRYREQEVVSSRLQTQLANAQLQALKMQLHPHFLFNTMHSVSMLNLTDVDAANRVLVKLSDLLRMTLSNTDVDETRLKDEVDFLSLYLEIEGMRFGDRLRTEFDVPDEALDAMVPTLILQPIVENAVRHGVATVSSSGTLRIGARIVGSIIQLEVSDDGPGLPADFELERDAGVGLRNVLDRLAHPEVGGKLEFERRTNGGTTARLTVPFRSHANAEQMRDHEP